MAAPRVCDEFWALIAALVPPERREADGPPIPSRASPTGMLFVLKSGIPSRGAAGRDGLRLKDELSAPFAGVAARGLSGSACITSCSIAWAVPTP